MKGNEYFITLAIVVDVIYTLVFERMIINNTDVCDENIVSVIDVSTDIIRCSRCMCRITQIYCWVTSTNYNRSFHFLWIVTIVFTISISIYYTLLRNYLYLPSFYLLLNVETSKWPHPNNTPLKRAYKVIVTYLMCHKF